MSDPEINDEVEAAADEDMAEAEETNAGDGNAEATGLEDIEPEMPERTTFLECAAPRDEARRERLRLTPYQLLALPHHPPPRRLRF